MTSRTIPFWENILDQELDAIANAPSCADVALAEARAIGFARGLWVADKISLNCLNLHTGNISLKSQNRVAELKAIGAR